MHRSTKTLDGIHHCTVILHRYQAEPLTEEILIQEQQRAEDMLQAASAGIAPTAAQSASDTKNTAAAATSRLHCSFVSSHSVALQNLQLADCGVPQAALSFCVAVHPTLNAAGTKVKGRVDINDDTQQCLLQGVQSPSQISTHHDVNCVCIATQLALLVNDKSAGSNCRRPDHNNILPKSMVQSMQVLLKTASPRMQLTCPRCRCCAS